MELVSCDSVKRRAPVRLTPAFRKPVINIAQPELIPPTLNEMVPSDDPCRLVMAMVSLLDLSSLKKRLSLAGAPHYPIEIMLSLEMFSRWDGEFGSRRVEKRCKHDTRYKLLCQGHTPPYSTIWRFRRFLGESLDDLLAETVALGKKAGLQSLGRASIDGTKLPAAASQWRKFREACDEADKELSFEFEGSSSDPDLAPAGHAPDMEVEAAPKGSVTEFTDDEQTSSDPSESDAQETATQIISKSKKSKKKPEALPSKDPDARTIRARQGHFIVGYNPQVIVDRDTDLIMAIHMSNQSGDSALLEPTLGKYLQIHGELPSELMADAGYDTPKNAHVLAELGIDAFVSCKERAPFWRLDQDNRPMCPMGHTAQFYSTSVKKGVPVTRLFVKECPSCQVRSQCLAKEESVTKTISFDATADPQNWIRQKHKAKSEEGKEALKDRGQTIEFLFARMKERFGFRRLSMWGMQGARIEVGIMALAMNLAIIASKAGMEGLAALLAALILCLYVCLRPQTRCQRPVIDFSGRIVTI